MNRVDALERRVRELEAELCAARAQRGRVEDSEARLRLAAETSGIGLWTWDRATDKVSWDERLCAIFEVAPADAPTDYARWRALLHPDDSARVEAHVREAARTGFYGEMEHRIVRPSGEVRWIHALGSAALDADGAVARLMGAAVDVTERHNLEEQLRHAVKMEAVARIAAGVAHNFNNLLAVVIPNIDAAARTSPAVAAQLEPAREAARRAAAIVRELAGFAEGGLRASRAWHEVGDLARGAVEACSKTFDPWIRWEVELAPALPLARVDPSKVEQAIVNVLLNARDALREAPGADPSIAVQVYREPERVCVRVVDTGAGMDDATRARIFDPFFTTKGPTSGAGLGLTAAYAIVREHAGAIACASQPGAGTALTLSFPIDEAPSLERAAGREGGAPRGRGERVLVVDDERLLRRVLRALLESAGYEVVEAVDGEAAIEALARDGGDIHVVSLDRSMPGLGGAEVMAWVKRERPALRVIGYSGHDKAIEGVRAMLIKPVEPDVLLATVRNVLDAP